MPDTSCFEDAQARAGAQQALDYMGLLPGTRLTDIAIDQVFIGSCTNNRLSDLRDAARVLKGRQAKVPGFVVPGSGLIKAQAEAEGLDKIFTDAGRQWRSAGCSMCADINGDIGKPGERIASTSNRNFVGRQGPGARTHLISPAMNKPQTSTTFEPFTTLTACAAAVPGPNIDTDQINPARFLKKDRAQGYGQFLFHDMRFNETGDNKPHPLNAAKNQTPKVLVVDDNFGCGSSREGAVYALVDYAIRAVVGTTFGDIFHNN